MTQEICNVVRDARLGKRLTIEALSRIADVSTGCVERAERLGRLSPTAEGQLLAKVLGLPEPLRTVRRRGPVLPKRRNEVRATRETGEVTP